MNLAARIAKNPGAYVSRTSSIETARRWGQSLPRSKGAAILHGDTPGEFWVISRGRACRALVAAGYEMVELA